MMKKESKDRRRKASGEEKVPVPQRNAVPDKDSPVLPVPIMRGRGSIDPTALKSLLDSLVEPEEREFGVVFSQRKTKYKTGSYHRSFFCRRITLYPNCEGQDRINMIGTALHELTHHLVWHRYSGALWDHFDHKRKIPSHEKFFKHVLDGLIAEFNLRYRKRLKGGFAFNRCRPTDSLCFLPSKPEDEPAETLLDVFEKHFASLPLEEAEKRRKAFWRKKRKASHRGFGQETRPVL